MKDSLARQRADRRHRANSQRHTRRFTVAGVDLDAAARSGQPSDSPRRPRPCAGRHELSNFARDAPRAVAVDLQTVIERREICARTRVLKDDIAAWSRFATVEATTCS